MNHENVEKLRDYLRDEVPDERFDMRSYVRGGSMTNVRARLNECGTAACIGGWAAYLFTPRRRWAHEHAGRALGLDNDQAEELFEPDGLHDRARYSRARAVATLTRLLETGTVDWGTE